MIKFERISQEDNTYCTEPRYLTIPAEVARDGTVHTIEIYLVHTQIDGWQMRVRHRQPRHTSTTTLKLRIGDDPKYVSMVYTCVVNEIERNIHLSSHMLIGEMLAKSVPISNSPDYVWKDKDFLIFLLKGLSYSNYTINFTKEQLDKAKSRVY